MFYDPASYYTISYVTPDKYTLSGFSSYLYVFVCVCACVVCWMKEVITYVRQFETIISIHIESRK